MARLCKCAQKQSMGNESRVICMKLYHPTKCGVCGWSRLAQTLRAHSTRFLGALRTVVFPRLERKKERSSVFPGFACPLLLPPVASPPPHHTMVKQLQMPRSVYTSSVLKKSSAVQSCFRSCALSIQWGISINISNLLLSILQIAAVTCSES